MASLTLAGVHVDTPARTGVHAAELGAKFVPHEPLRVLDSRTGVGMPAHKLIGQESVTLRFDESTGVPADATAVALNVTVTESSGAGFVSAWPTGTPRPTVSSVNVTSADQTIANFAIVPLGANRSIDLFTYSGAHLVVDYSGFWVPADVSTDGRYLAITPSRVFDTRDLRNRPSDGGTVDVQITGRPGVPADATAAVVGVTAVGAVKPAFVTVWPAGSARPLASTLNVAGPDAVANMALVPLGPGGRISLFAQHSADLIVDIQGYVTGTSSGSSSAGLFVAVAPTRVADSRDDLGLARMGAFFDQELPLAGVGGVPATGVSAVAANFTVTQTRAPGYLSVYPSRTRRPLVSTLNFTAGSTVAAFGLPKVGGQGLGLVTMKQADVIVDVSGYFLGEPVVAVTPPPIKCSDLMIYDHAPEGIDNAVDYELRIRDLSGNNPDRSLVDPSIFFRVAPGCQYVTVARESVRFPGSLALYRYDSVLQPTEPTLISDDLPWLGAAITDNAEWIYLYAGWIDLGGPLSDAVIAVNAWTGEERLVLAGGFEYIVGVSPQNRPVVLRTPASGEPELTYCNFGVPQWMCNYPQGRAVEANAQAGYSAFVNEAGVWWRIETPVTSGTHALPERSGYHPRLMWGGGPGVGVIGRGYVVWRTIPDFSNGLPVSPLWDAGEVVLDGVVADYPEFSRPLSRQRFAPPDLTRNCAYLATGCPPEV